MKHNYHERKQNRIDYAQNQAEKNIANSEKLCEKSHDMLQVIPPGQPILVGHHSEKAHRSLLARSDNAMRASVAADDKAKYYKEKAKAIIDNKAISSDNPDALPLLREKLEKLEKEQELKKAINKFIRKNDEQGYMQLSGSTPERWAKLNTPDRVFGKGIPSFELRNLNAKINNVKQRIRQQEALESVQQEEKTVKDCTMIVNPEVGRIQLQFPSKPVEAVRQKLRDLRFNYSYTQSAWQRFINNDGRWAAKTFLEWYKNNPE
ncbi:hypothetical protein HNQ91_000682 [Filimonas zeae]|uniref:DUF3560 domain-containing protein n=1 Tax=Filimonas zeae TaxID=1737353 RepID=A0A917IQF2_9BACT|nr:DUF3560 domain-containing protein [Filimonas zeae]MDR6337660.1 hypothetical protein [Filimonas zeae]GGH59674.1 hypothetical protein GCM10011379_06710 [Filimonas zeae]